MGKKKSLITRLLDFSGAKKPFVILSCVLAAISTIFVISPFILLWFVIREILQALPEISQINVSALMGYAWMAVGAAVIGFLLYYVALLCSHAAAFTIARNIKLEALHHLATLPLSYFTSHASGTVRKVIDENADATETFVAHQMPDFISAMVTPVIMIACLFIFDWRLGLLSLVPLLVGFLIQGAIMGSTAPKYIKQLQDAGEDMNREAVEYVRGIPVVKIFGQTIYSFKSFYRSILNYKENITAFALACEWPMNLFNALINGTFIVLIPFGILLLTHAADSREFLLDWLFYVLFTPACASMINKIMYLSTHRLTAEEAMNRIDSLLDEQPLPKTSAPQYPSNSSIAFSDVTFTYPGASIPALQGLSFQVPVGKTFALVGASGSGKSTTASLIPRFYDVDSGKVEIGGVDVRDMDEKVLMEQVAFVFQTTHLFKKSILDNVRAARPNATEQEVIEALKAAQCEDIIEKFPSGIHTMIGTEGVYLSGGETQRIALARAILKDAPIIVLDEATSFADAENEYKIQRAFEQLTRGKTVLMIAHRLSTVKNADQILVMERGKIVEQGTHSELLNRNGIFAGLWKQYQQSVTWNIGKGGSTYAEKNICTQ